MLQITKIFRFEMAHAIHDYPGKCKDIHGHSYELHITVTTNDHANDFIPAPGLIMDFRTLKQLVNDTIISQLDHRLVLSKNYLKENPSIKAANLLVWEAEPSAENILVYIQKALAKKLQAPVKPVKLKLYETSDSYAEWVNN